MDAPKAPKVVNCADSQRHSDGKHHNRRMDAKRSAMTDEMCKRRWQQRDGCEQHKSFMDRRFATPNIASRHENSELNDVDHREDQPIDQLALIHAPAKAACNIEASADHRNCGGIAEDDHKGRKSHRCSANASVHPEGA